MEGICMFVINGKGFLIFLPGFCVIIFAYVVSVSFGVRDSRNGAQFAPSLRAPKKTISRRLEAIDPGSQDLFPTPGGVGKRPWERG